MVSLEIITVEDWQLEYATVRMECHIFWVQVIHFSWVGRQG